MIGDVKKMRLDTREQCVKVLFTQVLALFAGGSDEVEPSLGRLGSASE